MLTGELPFAYPVGACASLGYVAHQRGRRNPKCSRQFENCRKTWISFASFKEANVVAMQVRLLSQFLLAE